MSKTTKIIAALGVVAGLGVAALPAFTFATGEKAVSGNVDVYVEVPDAIAMTITGNNDGNHWVADAGATGVDVFNPATGEPSTVDGHSRSNTTKTLSSAYASLTQNGVIHGHDIASGGEAYGDASGAGFLSDITVYTNYTGGYALTAGVTSTKTISETVTPALINQGNNDYYIPTGSGVAAGTSAWGYSTTAPTEESGVFSNTYTAFAVNNNAIASRATATSGGDNTKVYYGVSTSADQASGLYKGTVVYTATGQQ